jgi:hypothetical protein
MRWIVMVALVLLALWLLSAIVAGLYYAADGGHGGKPLVILVSVALGAILLFADVALIWRLWGTKQRQA